MSFFNKRPPQNDMRFNICHLKLIKMVINRMYISKLRIISMQNDVVIR